jgi:hypothetical protein
MERRRGQDSNNRSKPAKNSDSRQGGAESGAVDVGNGEIGADLAAVINAWTVLTDEVKKDILARVAAAATNAQIR